VNLLKIYRTNDNGRQTIGKAFVVDSDIQEISFECYTLELPWKYNKQKVSCIPTGKYSCSKAEPTVKFPYKHFDVHNVQGRSGIKGHGGNYVFQILGCLLFGDKLVDMNKDLLKDVTNSIATLGKLLSVLPENFELQIIDGTWK